MTMTARNACLVLHGKAASRGDVPRRGPDGSRTRPSDRGVRDLGAGRRRASLDKGH